MAETRKIVIEIRGGGGGPSPDPGGGTTVVNIDMAIHPIQSVNRAALGAYSVLINQAYQNAKSAISSEIEYSANRYFQMREDYIGETTYSNAKVAVSKATSLVSSVLSGAMMGSAVPGGAAIGAVIAAGGWVATNIIEISQRQRTAMVRLASENASLAFARSRAGLTDGGRGTEN